MVHYTAAATRAKAFRSTSEHAERQTQAESRWCVALTNALAGSSTKRQVGIGVMGNIARGVLRQVLQVRESLGSGKHCGTNKSSEVAKGQMLCISRTSRRS